MYDRWIYSVEVVHAKLLLYGIPNVKLYNDSEHILAWNLLSHTSNNHNILKKELAARAWVAIDWRTRLQLRFSFQPKMTSVAVCQLHQSLSSTPVSQSL